MERTGTRFQCCYCNIATSLSLRANQLRQELTLMTLSLVCLLPQRCNSSRLSLSPHCSLSPFRNHTEMASDKGIYTVFQILDSLALLLDLAKLVIHVLKLASSSLNFATKQPLTAVNPNH
ncbi:hypothetical protein AMECASPLE_035466 [Ameca splendens]|uniref:Uncharacterized protein n=1 Tax=Ameca splendens TaxID=208324 RepID=A0ABV0ZGM8_9TELE